MKSQEIQWLLEEKYNGQKTEGFLTDCARLEAGEPLAYIIGHIPFLDSTIYLDSHPLIPRTETEYWTKHLIDTIHAQTTPKTVKVLDLCAGSGCSGVAIAKSLSRSLVDFAELDSLHLPTILRNLTENNIDPERCHIMQSDLYTSVTDRYNIILSNPPYIDPVIDRTQKSVKAHEPHLALYGGVDGMELIERIIQDAPDHLLPHGQLWIEHEPEQSRAIQSLGGARNFTTTTHTDQYEVERYSVLVLQ